MIRLLFLFLLVEFSTLVLAEDISSPGNDSGAYINLNEGITKQQFLPTGGFMTAFNAGYKFNRGLALEGGYSIISSQEFQADQIDQIFDIAVKGIIPFTNHFALYGRLGAGVDYMGWNGTAYGAPSWYCNQNSTSYVVGLTGIGASFTLSKQFELHLEDNLYIPMGGGNLTVGQLNSLLGGVQFNF